MLKYTLPGIIFDWQLEIIEFFVEVTVLLMLDCVAEEGVVTEYPLGSLSELLPLNPYTFDQPEIVSGWM